MVDNSCASGWRTGTRWRGLATLAVTISLVFVNATAAVADHAPQRVNAVLGQASGPISLAGGRMTPDQTNQESPATSMVAQMYKDVLGAANPEFIGIQSAAGTRAGVNQGEITTDETSAVLPQGYTLMTTHLTGAQLRLVLEQQWQRDATGQSLPYLRLGLSSNVTYLYDENQPAGSRIRSIHVNGLLVSPSRVYTVGSSSHLIGGGDNFSAFTQGTNTTNTGKSDQASLQAWITQQQTISPRYAMSGVQITDEKQGPALANTNHFYDLGWVPNAGVAPDSLDNSGLGAPKTDSCHAQLVQGAMAVDINCGGITSGWTSTYAYITTVGGFVSGAATVVTTFNTGTVVRLPLTLSMPGKSYAWGDQTGDGMGDLLAVDSQGGLHLYGSVLGHRQVGRGWAGFTWMSHVPDVTGDGIDDLLARRSDGAMYLYRSIGGDAKFASAKLVGTGWNGVRSLTIVGDLTGDKTPELLGIDSSQQLLRYSLTSSAITGRTIIGKGWSGFSFIVGAGSFNYTEDTTNDVLAFRADGAVFAYLTNRAGAIYSYRRVHDPDGLTVEAPAVTAVWQLGAAPALGTAPAGTNQIMVMNSQGRLLGWNNQHGTLTPGTSLTYGGSGFETYRLFG